MNLLHRLTPHLRRISGPGRAFTLGVVFTVAAVELLGRFAASELVDAAAAAVLAGVAAAAAAWHRHDPLPWVGALVAAGRRARRAARGWEVSCGIDLRGRPLVRPGWPPLFTAMVLGLLAVGAAAAAAAAWLPDGVRPYATRVCYTGYAAGLLGLWAVAGAAALVAALIPLVQVHDALLASAAARPGEGPPVGPGRLAVFGMAAVAVLALLYVPVWVFLAAVAGAWAAHLATTALPAGGPFRYVWRRKRGRGTARSVGWAAWSSFEMTVVTLVAADLVLLCCGGSALRWGSAGWPVTVSDFLGRLLAAFAAVAVWAWVAFQVVLPRWRDPARPVRPVLHAAGGLPPALRASLASRGWRVSADPVPGDDAVRVELVSPGRSQAGEFDPRWPLAVSGSDLTRPDVLERLARRDEIQLRRKFVGGLERLFKAGARKKRRAGEGYLFAPHLWFVSGLTRDGQDDETPDGPILAPSVGPGYHAVFGPACRHHLYRVLRALEVDMIFIEDGVTFPRFRRVVRKLFDVYDRHAGQRRAEESQFTGLPGTRVIVHEFTLEEPFKSTKYPEPKFDMLGRARVLLVFRDRGEQEEPLDAPFDFTSSPSPLAMV